MSGRPTRAALSRRAVVLKRSVVAVALAGFVTFAGLAATHSSPTSAATKEPATGGSGGMFGDAGTGHEFGQPSGTGSAVGRSGGS